jgi:phenylacetate-coenzyme A ligase PaaK-like adenylate-forming protein
VLTQCEHGTFHENTATCRVDIEPFRPDRGDPDVGRILVSTIDNPWFVLLRFDVGDLARIRGSEPCACGRLGGVTATAIEGRLRDLTFDTRGRAVTVKALDDALSAAGGLVGYQVEQRDRDRFLARWSAEPGSERSTAGLLPDILHAVYGRDARIESRQDSALPPEQSGKFRLARTAFPWRAEELFA